MRNTIVALVLGLALVTAGIAYAGDDAPTAQPAAKTPAAKTPAVKMTTTAAKADTATPSPIHSMMKWVSSHVMEGDGCGCPSTAEGEKAWRVWFKAENPELATLRGQLMADGWTADKTIGFFKAMAASKSCDSCDKAKGASAATGDAGKTGDAAGGCCKDKGGCKDKKDCGGCDKKAEGAAAPAGDAGKTGDASDPCPCTGKPKKDCSGCGKDTCPCGK